MPWVNRTTGQIMGGAAAQQQAPSQPSGGFNPASLIRPGLSLGGRFLGGGAGNALMGLGNLAGLGSAIANKNPVGIGTNALQLGLTGAKQGLFGPGVAKSLTSTLGLNLAPSAGFSNLGGLVGASAGQGPLAALGPIGAIAGFTSLLSGLLSSKAQNPVFTGNPFTGFMGTSGQTLKDIKAEAGVLNAARRDLVQNVQQGKATPIDQLRVLGSYTKQADGKFVGAASYAPQLLARLLNAGVEVPKENGMYVLPLSLYDSGYKAGQQSLRFDGSHPQYQATVAIAPGELKTKIDPITGQTTYSVPKESRPAAKARDRRSEERSIGRQD